MTGNTISVNAELLERFAEAARENGTLDAFANIAVEWAQKAEAEIERLSADCDRFDLIAHIHRAREFSARTFGPGARTAGVIAHIQSELAEIERDPFDLFEWVDVVILALDGAWRAGYEPEEIVAALVAKQDRNEARQWPDWRTAPADRPIEHIADEGEPPRNQTARLRDIVQTIGHALDGGVDARDILDEHSPIRDAIRRERREARD